jgi:hypothetical protein
MVHRVRPEPRVLFCAKTLWVDPCLYRQTITVPSSREARMLKQW